MKRVPRECQQSMQKNQEGYGARARALAQARLDLIDNLHLALFLLDAVRAGGPATARQERGAA